MLLLRTPSRLKKQMWFQPVGSEHCNSPTLLQHSLGGPFYSLIALLLTAIYLIRYTRKDILRKQFINNDKTMRFLASKIIIIHNWYGSKYLYSLSNKWLNRLKYYLYFDKFIYYTQKFFIFINKVVLFIHLCPKVRHLRYTITATLISRSNLF